MPRPSHPPWLIGLCLRLNTTLKNEYFLLSLIGSTVHLWTFASSFFFWFPNLFRHMVGLLGRVISFIARPVPTKDKYPCPKRDSNPRSSVRAIKARAKDRAATGSASNKYSRASLFRTNWDSGMLGLVNFRINRVLQNTRRGESENTARSRVKVTTRGG
jgi:hypothetical protein